MRVVGSSIHNQGAWPQQAWLPAWSSAHRVQAVTLCRVCARHNAACRVAALASRARMYTCGVRRAGLLWAGQAACCWQSEALRIHGGTALYAGTMHLNAYVCTQAAHGYHHILVCCSPLRSMMHAGCRHACVPAHDAHAGCTKWTPYLRHVLYLRQILLY